MSASRRRSSQELGTTSRRGYGTRHQAERKKWIPIVNAGNAVCTLCGGRIVSGTPFDLDHSDAPRLSRGRAMPQDDLDRLVSQARRMRALHRRTGAIYAGDPST
jgi:hypothetical protein